MRLEPPRKQLLRLGVQRLGVDGNEGVGAGDGNGLGAEAFENLDHQVARHRTVLIYAHGKPRKRRAISGGVAVDVGRAGILLVRCTRRLRFGYGAECRADGGFIRLGNFPGGRVELQPVAVGGDMRSGDHDRCGSGVERRQRKSRGRQRAAIHCLQSRGRHGVDHPGGNLRRGGAQVASHVDRSAMRAGGDEGSDVIADQLLCQLCHKAAQAAGSEFRCHGW